MRRCQEVFERFETLGQGQIHVPKSDLTVGCQPEESLILNAGDIQDTRLFRATSVLVWMELLARLTDKEKVIGDRGTIDSNWSLWIEHGRNNEKVPQKMRNAAD